MIKLSIIAGRNTILRMKVNKHFEYFNLISSWKFNLHHTYLTSNWFTLKSVGKLEKAKTLENKEQNTIRPRKLVNNDACQKCDKIRQKQNQGNIIVLLLTPYPPIPDYNEFF